MRVAVVCEKSNVVAGAFRALGHSVTSFDILPNEVSQDHHILGDARLSLVPGSFDMLIGFPPCTYLCRPQIWRLSRDPARYLKSLDAAQFVRWLWSLPIPSMAIENPPGILPRMWRPYDDLIHPYMFGAPHFKEYCLWLRGLPPLIRGPVSLVRKSLMNKVNGRMSQAQKAVIKSRFFPQVAEAMAIQWGSVL